MRLFNPSTLISLIALLIYSALLVIILRQNYKSRVHLSFSLYLLSMIVWSFGSFMMFANSGYGDTLFWNRFLVVGSTAMPIAFFGFVQVFLMKERKNWFFVGLITYLGIQIVNFMGFVITKAYVSEGKLYNEYGSSIVILSLSWLFFVGFSTYYLVKELRSTKDDFYRNRLRYLLFVIMVIFAGSLTNTTALQVLPVDIAFNALAALLITYAILRYQLLDINVVIRKGLLYSIPTIFIGASYFLIISFAIRIFHGLADIQIYLLSLIVAITSALIVQPVLDKAQSLIDRIFFREKYDSFIMLQRISRTSTTVLDIDKLTRMILNEISSALHVKEAAFFLKHGVSGEFTLITQIGLNTDTRFRLRRDHPIVHQFAAYDRALSMREVNVLPQFKALWEQEMDILDRLGAELLIPVKFQGELVGIFSMGQKLSGETYSQDDQLTLMTMANQTAVAIENARLYAMVRQELTDRKSAEERLQLQIQRMSSLHTIDVAITSSVNLQVILQVLLDVLTNQLVVDAAAVLLLDAYTYNLEYTASRGFHTSALQHTRLSLGDGLAGQAAAQQSIIHIPNLKEEITSLSKSPLLADEGFISYYGVPLIAKSKIKGVLEIFHRTPLEPNPEWIGFLETLATETAIAVDNAEMFNDLQHSNLELTQAYATTLEGWSRALELRDRETEGHTQRVTEVTIELARRLGVDGNEIVHMRRGVLLHDIGKMGIPDSILLKPGPLTPEEWEIMRQHPVHAFKLLSTIHFLRPALDIPHYHHEKWDGTGYPLGLKGEEIPLAARIFAVVDVWDALRSERPYRPAWKDDAVTLYILEQSNRHFDPKVVETFLNLINEMSEIIQRAINH